MTKNKTIFERLQFDGNRDLSRLLTAFREQPECLVPAGLKPHFDVARNKPDGFLNHAPLLALSFGGSNTSVMLAEIKDGVPVVLHAVERPNPDHPVPMEQYLDEILLAEAPFVDYLKNADAPVIGTAVAVMVKNGVPYHPSKLATIDGLCARDPDAQAETHHFGRNFQAYLKKNGLKPASMVYEGDAPVAHLGGVGLTDMDPQDRSLLLVCGNGMATADYDRFIVCGLYRFLCDDDPDLYRAEDTEDGQYQYVVAGKGLYKVMKRAAEIKTGEPGSVLGGVDLDAMFATARDTGKVYRIWESTQDESVDVADVRSAAGDAAFSELQELASALVPRGISCLANSVMASVAFNGPAESGNGYELFLEGSIGTDPFVVPLLEEEMERLSRDVRLFMEHGLEAPEPPRIVRELKTAVAGPGLDDADIKDVDITLIGAAFMAAASDFI